MKYLHDLPSPVGLAIANDPYDSEGAAYTPSSFNEPARIRALTRRHAHEMVSKTSARWWQFFGTLAHGILERIHLPEGASSEVRLFAEFEDKRIGGKYDLYVGPNALRLDPANPCAQDIEPFTIADFKSMKSYALVFQNKNGAVKPEWEQQLNVLAWLARKNGLRVDHLQIIPLLLDWSADEALDASDYPQKPSLLVDVPLWPDAKVESFMRARIAEHERCGDDVPDDELPMCSPEERWERQAAWKALKPDGKSQKNEPTEEALLAYLDRKGLDRSRFTIKFFPGKQTRCRAFCAAARFCDFGRAELAKLEAEAT